MHEQECLRLDLVIELQRLLRLAGQDERAAIEAFDVLKDRYRPYEVAVALTAVTAEYLGRDATSL